MDFPCAAGGRDEWRDARTPEEPDECALEKEGLDPAQRRKINAHFELLNVAKAFAPGMWERQAPDERASKIDIMSKAIDEWPIEVAMHMVHVAHKDMITAATGSNSKEEMRANFDEALTLLLPFGPVGTKKFNPQRPCLHDLEISAMDKADMFKNSLFADHFSNWIEAGAPKEDIVMTFCDVAHGRWKLGDEDDIEEAAAYILKEARTIVQMFLFLCRPKLSESTPALVLQSLRDLVDQAHNTKETSITAMCAIAATTPNNSWGQALRKLKPALGLFSEEAPKIIHLLREIKGEMPIAVATAQRLTAIADQANYFQSSMYDGVADNLESRVIELAASHAKAICDMPNLNDGKDGETKCDKLQSYSALFNRLTKLFYTSEVCEKASADIQKSLAGLDAQERHNALRDALWAFEETNSHTWPRLAAALINVGAPTEIPDEAKERSFIVFTLVSKLLHNEGAEDTSDLADLLSKLVLCVPPAHAEACKRFAQLTSCYIAMRGDLACHAEFEDDPDRFILDNSTATKTENLCRHFTMVLNLLQEGLPDRVERPRLPHQGLGRRRQGEVHQNRRVHCGRRIQEARAVRREPREQCLQAQLRWRRLRR